MPIDIRRTRAFTGDGFGPSRSHTVIKASPTTLRNNSMVSTSQCDAMMILASTSATPSENAAASPGATEKTKREAKRNNSCGIPPDAIRGGGLRRNPDCGLAQTRRND